MIFGSKQPTRLFEWTSFFGLFTSQQFGYGFQILRLINPKTGMLGNDHANGDPVFHQP